MNRKTLIPTGAALLAALGIAAGGVALAQDGSAGDLRNFIEATPGAAEGLTAVEAQTGGTVVEAEIEDDAPGLIEFEVEMADGSESDVYWSVADGAVVTEADLLARFVEATFDAPPEPQAPAPQPRVRAVPASSGGLVRATLGSAAAAGAILALFWLPAEYGVDATGLGRVMGLTQMGEIKQQLYTEAEAEDAALAVQAAPAIAMAPEVLERLGAIEAQVAAIATAVGIGAALPAPAPVAEPPVAAPAAAPPTPTTATGAPAATTWRDEVAYTLTPGEGIEVKLVMEEGATAAFEWDAGGGVLNYDIHADGSGQKISYEQGRAVPEQAGELVAAFTGNHGWFWRNRTEGPVTLTLRTRGDYAEMRSP